MDVVEDTVPLYKSIDRTLEHVSQEHLDRHPYELTISCRTELGSPNDLIRVRQPELNIE